MNGAHTNRDEPNDSKVWQFFSFVHINQAMNDFIFSSKTFNHICQLIIFIDMTGD